MSHDRDIPAEKALFDAANGLRGSVESAEYKHLVLGLVFLKYVSDGFEARRVELSRLVRDQQSEWYAENEDERADIVEDRDAYKVANVFWVPREARWDALLALGSQPDLGVQLDRALDLVERENTPLKDVLPRVYARAEISPETLGRLVSTVAKIGFGSDPDAARDVLGRVYEYFIKEFARAEGHRGGEFYTPANVVRLLVEMLQPYEGRILDPACGSCGMFVQSAKFLRAHAGSGDELAIYGQELNQATWRIGRMNLAIHGLSGNVALTQGGSLLGPNGRAGFVLANGSLTSMQSGEGAIRERLVRDDLVDCVVALPGQLFYTTGIPVCLWFLDRDKASAGERDRRGETLFIDARSMGAKISRTQIELSDEEIERVVGTYSAWRGQDGAVEYEDELGFCASVALDGIEQQGFTLSPGRYVGAPAEEEDEVAFEERMAELVETLEAEMVENQRLARGVREALNRVGYGG